jgi:hypothetical protein
MVLHCLSQSRRTGDIARAFQHLPPEKGERITKRNEKSTSMNALQTHTAADRHGLALSFCTLRNVLTRTQAGVQVPGRTRGRLQGSSTLSHPAMTLCRPDPIYHLPRQSPHACPQEVLARRVLQVPCRIQLPPTGNKIARGAGPAHTHKPMILCREAPMVSAGSPAPAVYTHTGVSGWSAGAI